jgi:hypothetical protein
MRLAWAERQSRLISWRSMKLVHFSGLLYQAHQGCGDDQGVLFALAMVVGLGAAVVSLAEIEPSHAVAASLRNQDVPKNDPPANPKYVPISNYAKCHELAFPAHDGVVDFFGKGRDLCGLSGCGVGWQIGHRPTDLKVDRPKPFRISIFDQPPTGAVRVAKSRGLAEILSSETEDGVFANSEIVDFDVTNLDVGSQLPQRRLQPTMARARGA